MKTRSTRQSDASGYALLITLGTLAVMLILLAGVCSWTNAEARLTERNNLYQASVIAAESATEMVLARMDRDFMYQSANQDLSVYRNLTPAALQADWPIQFQFSDNNGTMNETGVESLGPSVVGNLNSEFSGLYGIVTPFRIVSRARTVDRLVEVSAAVSQEIQLAAIPVYQFAIFYNLNLEVNPGKPMVITGKVHSNGKIFTAPVVSLTYMDDVTAVDKIVNNRDPNDPQYGSPKVRPVYKGKHVENVSSLTLPIGQSVSGDSLHQIIEPPPVGENPNSPLGQERYYNKADLIVTTTDTGVSITTGRWNSMDYVPMDTVDEDGNPCYSFITTYTKGFNDLRENLWTMHTELDVAALKLWIQGPGNAINNLAKFRLGHGLNSVYINDLRRSPSRLPAVRVVNGASLPADGLTVATPLPLYVKGHFNLNKGTDTKAGQSDTTYTRPASLVGDAITVLSPIWDDSYAGKDYSNRRKAENTTVNAALLAGLVPTTLSQNKKYYSGGVENYPRLLENWDSATLTYNGSMVAMFQSEYATSFWQGTYYKPPTRAWSFDFNFRQHAKLPPCTPQVRKLVRGNWKIES